MSLAADTDTGTPGVQTSIAEGAGATTVRVTATLSTERSSPTELRLRIAGGTADHEGDNKDYDPSSSLTDTTVDITIAAGDTSGFADVTITPVQDRFNEGNGQTILISAIASDDLAVTGDVVTIADDDETSTTVALTVDTDPVMSGPQTGIGEGDGSPSVVVTATLDNAVRSTATTITLTFTGSAVRGSGNDYELSGTLSVTIPADEVSGSRTITIIPHEERIDDGDKTIVIGGTPPGGSGLSVTPASTITLSDNDDAPTAIKLTVSPTSVREQGPVGGGRQDRP